MPARLLTAEGLDLDDLGAEIGQDHAAARSGLKARELEDADPIECKAHRSILRSVIGPAADPV